MHQDDRFARPSGGGEHVRVEGPGRDVVDDVCACGDRFGCDAGAVGVDADGGVGCFGHRTDELDGRNDALEFLCFADVRGARARGLAADVEDGDAGCDVGFDRLGEGNEIGGGVDAAVGEGVWS